MACESELRCESLHPLVKVWPVSDVDRHGVALTAEAAWFASNCSIVCSERTLVRLRLLRFFSEGTASAGFLAGVGSRSRCPVCDEGTPSQADQHSHARGLPPTPGKKPRS